MIKSLVVLMGLLAAAPWISAEQVLSFRLGATVGQNGSCAPLYNDTVLGYQYFFDWLAQRSPFLVTDASGKTYSLRLQLRLVTHDCTEQGRAAAMTSLIQGEPPHAASGAPAQLPVHLLLGGHGDNALEDALQADNASRILLHCCTARDAVFRLGLPYVYGMFTPASLYTGTVLRTMALRGMQRVAVVYSRESLLHVQLCEGALTQLEPLGELRPGFGVVLSVNYTAADAVEPGFWQALGAQLVSANADVLIACDGTSRTSKLVHEVRSRGRYLSALWLASSDKVTEFVGVLDGYGEYVLTTVQWMQNLPYADPDFGTAAQYAAAFANATGLEPSYFSAAATASGYVLLKALQRAIMICNLDNLTSEADAAADAFMWSEGALTCSDTAHRAVDLTGSSGTAILRYTLGTLGLDTFFGPVGFNGYHQNIFHPVVVAQVLDSKLVAVLPLDVADKALVMPIPGDPPAAKPWVETPIGISIITLLFCLGAVCVGLAVFTCWRRGPVHLHGHSVEIKMEDIQVDIPPQFNADGSCEPGEGVYRGTRVKLVVAQELMLQPYSSNRNLRPMKPEAQSPSMPGFRDNSVGRREPSAGQRSPGAAPLRSFAVASAATANDASRSPALRSKSAALETLPPADVDAEADVAAAAATLLPTTARIKDPPLEDSLSLGSSPVARKHQSERLLRKQSDTVLQRVTGDGLSGAAAAAPSPAMSLGGRAQAPTMHGPLSQRARRQALALVWRAVRLQHPRMCPMLGIVWEWPGLLPAGMGGGAAGGRVPVLVRQWHEFDCLDRLLENETVPLPLLTKATIAQGVAEGLAYLHAQEPPIVAGPLDATRVIIDKHFNPHLFPRLANLDPEYGSAPAVGTLSDALRQQRAMSVAGGRPSPSQHLGAKGGAVGVRVLAQPSPWPKVAAIMAPATQANPDASTAVLPFSVGAALPNEDVVRTQPRLLSGSGNPFHPLQPRMTGLGAVPDAEPSVASMAGAAVARAVGLFAPPPPYQPSKAQDVYEFGLLLCRIFIEALPEDSGRLRFAKVASAAVMAVAATTVAGGDGDDEDKDSGPGNTDAVANAAAAATAEAAVAAAPAPILQSADPEQLEAVLGELSELCQELGDLARACTQPNSSLTFPAIAKALEQVVIPALTGSDGLPRGLRRNPLSIKVYGSARCGSGAGPGQDLELRSLSGSQTVCGRTASVSRGEGMKGLRGSFGPHHHHHHHHLAAASDDLLYDIFPPKVARALQAGETVQPERYDCVSIFFSDVVGYTDLCGQLQPGEVMDLVHRLYSRFDDLIRELRLFKVETVGDAYLAVGNLRWPQPDDHAVLMTQFAFAAVRAATSLPVHPDRPELGTVHVRVGLHCGPVVGSVVGTLNRRYCLFGDAVNTAARMEHNSLADRINCSGTFAALLREQSRGIGVELASRGVVNVKGKGPMEMFWLEEKPQPGGAAQPQPDGRKPMTTRGPAASGGP